MGADTGYVLLVTDAAPMSPLSNTSVLFEDVMEVGGRERGGEGRGGERGRGILSQIPFPYSSHKPSFRNLPDQTSISPFSRLEIYHNIVSSLKVNPNIPLPSLLLLVLCPLRRGRENFRKFRWRECLRRGGISLMLFCVVLLSVCRYLYLDGRYGEIIICYVFVYLWRFREKGYILFKII